MRKFHWIISVLLACTIGISPAIATDAAQPADTGKLETIKAAPANEKHTDCPMHRGKKECEHKKCDHAKGDQHHGKSREKCDHKPRA